MLTTNKILRYALTIVATCCVALSCADGIAPEDNTGKVPENPSEEGTVETPQEPSDAPHTAISIGGTPDYSGLTASNHPRMLFTQADFDGIKASLQNNSNPALSQIHSEILYNADKAQTMSALVYDIYDGKRLLNICQEAISRILSCAYAYKTTGQAQYLEKAKEDLKAVCEFKDWNALRHGLDGAVMGSGVALAYDWLYNDLDEQTRATIVGKIKANWLDPVRTQYSSFHHDFYEMKNNWNQVCCGGIVASALAIYESDPENCRTLIQTAVSRNAPVVEYIYKPDGNYPEGYGYWTFGTNYQMLLNASLYATTGSEAGLAGKPGFEQSGKFMLYMEGPTKMCFNFYDCGNDVSPCYAQWYYAWQYADLSYLYIEKSRLSMYDNNMDSALLPLTAFFAHRLKITSLDSIGAPSDKVWSGNGTTPVVLVHSNWKMDETDKFLGIKGGKAKSNHGHMDAGSFVYDYKGVRWSADLGSQGYSSLEKVIPDLWSMSQTSGRWTVFRYNNRNHSTITINDADHLVDGAAVVKSVIRSGGKYGGVVDMTPAVSNQAAAVVRTIYIQGGDLIVSDKIQARTDEDAKVRWTMVTYGVPTIGTDKVTLKSKGQTLYMSKKEGPAVEWKTWKCSGKPGVDFGSGYDNNNPNMYMCGYETTVAKGQTATITIKLSPIG